MHFLPDPRTDGYFDYEDSKSGKGFQKILEGMPKSTMYRYITLNRRDYLQVVLDSMMDFFFLASSAFAMDFSALIRSVISLAIAEIATSSPDASKTGERVTETFIIESCYLRIHRTTKLNNLVSINNNIYRMLC